MDASANVPMTNGMVSGIRAGKIQWPPVKHDAHKEEVQVGRLMIDEKEREKQRIIEGQPHKMKLIKDASDPEPLVMRKTKFDNIGKLPMGVPPPPPLPEPIQVISVSLIDAICG